MKVPKEIDRALERRSKLAIELMAECSKIDRWLESVGICTFGIPWCDATNTGAMIYCEPYTAEKIVREAIEQYKER